MPKVRRYRSTDSAAAKRLFREISLTHRALYRPRRRPGRDPDHWYHSHMREHGPGSLRVVEDEGNVVGLVGLLPQGNHCEIEPLVVATRHRGRGYGGLLIRAVVDEAKRRGWRTLSAGVPARNEVALRAFHALGFRTLVDLQLSMNVVPPVLFSPRKGPRVAGLRFRK